MKRIIFCFIFYFTCHLPVLAANSVVIDSLLKEYNTAKNDSLKAFIFRDLSWEYIAINTDSALIFAQKSLRISTKSSCNNCLAKSYSQLASVYYYKGDYANAIENYVRALRLNEKINDRTGMMRTLNNLGGIHLTLENYSSAIEYFNQSYLVATELNDTNDALSSLTNLGLAYRKLDKGKSAQIYFNKALSMAKDQELIFSLYINLAGTYYDERDYPNSLNYYQKALEIGMLEHKDSFKAYALIGIANVYAQLNEPDRALEKTYKALEYANEIGIPEVKQLAYEFISKFNYKLGNYKEAYDGLDMYMKLKDSLFNAEKSKIISETETKFQVENKEKENKLLRQDNIIQELEIQQRDEKDKAKNNLIIAASIGIVLLVLLVVMIYARFLLKKRANHKLSEAFKIISEKNKDITDSMMYARDLQDALLPKRGSFKSNFQDSFVLFRPKDIVSGDFFWLEQTKNQLFFSVADCTGHGVPAAMVSVVAINGLTRSVKEMNLQEPDAILNQLNSFVEEAFQNSEREIMDGLDIAICSISRDSIKKDFIELNFSGANNPLWIVQSANSENKITSSNSIRENNYMLHEVKGDKQPIGKYSKREPFTTTHYKIEKGDTIYLFSDGYADQFGGPEGKKYKYLKLKKLILSIQHLPMEQQQIILEDEFDEWKGQLEQIDDVCIIGVRL